MEINRYQSLLAKQYSVFFSICDYWLTSYTLFSIVLSRFIDEPDWPTGDLRIYLEMKSATIRRI